MRSSLNEVPAHVGRIQKLVYDKDRDQIVSGGADGAIKLWDVSNISQPKYDFGVVFQPKNLFYQATHRQLYVPTGVSDIKVSEAGFFASGCDGTVRYFKRK
jgi:WD40 repeat protein